MPTCSVHGIHSGAKCFQCEVEESLERQKRAFEEAESNAATRHWEAEVAADHRANQLVAEQRALMRDANKIRARALQERARDLFAAKLFAEAAETCKDALREDRGHLPAYATLAAALYETGDIPAAAETMEKAIRLAGHGEWTGPGPLSMLLSWSDKRDFPSSVVTLLRETLRAYGGKVDGNLLRWLASRGWGEEVLRLLPRASVGCADLLFMADWLMAKEAFGAADEVVSQAVRLMGIGSPGAREQWLRIAFLALDLTLKGGGDDLPRVMAKTEGLADTEGLETLMFLAESDALRERGEISRRMLLATLAELAARWLNTAESRFAEEQLSKLPKPSNLLSWIPSVQQQDTEARARSRQQARTVFREEMLPLLRRSGIDQFLAAGAHWTVEAPAIEQAKTRYFGEVMYQQAMRAEKRHDWPAALSAFAVARERYAAAGDQTSESDALHEIGWCSCPSINPDGDWQRALDAFTAALKLDESCGRKRSLAANLYWQAWCSEHLLGPQGNWASCAELYRRAVTANREAERMDLEAGSLFRLGICCEKLKDWPTALDAFRGARERYAAAGDTVRSLESLREIGWCTCPNNNENGNWDEAYALYRGGEVLATEAGAKALIASFVYWQGWCQEPVNNPQGDWTTCIELYKRAATGAQEVEFWSLEAYSLHAIGFCHEPVHAPFGDWSTAAEWYRRAIPLWRKIANKERLANSLLRLGKSLSRDDRATVTPEARELFHEVSALKHSLGDAKGAAEAEEWARGCT